MVALWSEQDGDFGATMTQLLTRDGEPLGPRVRLTAVDSDILDIDISDDGSTLIVGLRTLSFLGRNLVVLQLAID